MADKKKRKRPSDARLQELGFRKFQKVEPVWAIQMDVPFTVDTKEGDNIKGKKGDYLCVGIDGERWPIDADIFARTYREIK
jgi:hypothetical protein